MTDVVTAKDATGNPVPFDAITDNAGGKITLNALSISSQGQAASPVTPTNPLPIVDAPLPLTPANPSAFAVAVGGTAVAAFAAGTIAHGAYVTNPPDATEDLFLDMVNSPLLASPGASGTTTRLAPGQSWTAPGPLTTAVMVNAATSGHAFTAVKW